ncbi:hypothetical protein PROFUN_04418 [Planoprotostelium fungivorum]|uniref:F-box domain-containing protein n=1 Tax=Planoprotostelium fungivorum TaxID=1890364 RepID=A0A2P6NHX7_9EUKA|nr:hypothetical protein PROFUN_04418 [Planoprotostelium fungivorum]
MQQHLPDDLWIDIFSFLPLADLCAPCFTSTTLRDAVCHLIHSRLLYPTYWWRHRKQLPVHNMEIAEWWLSNVREPTELEVLAAARTNQVELVDLLGWDDTHLSARHRNLTRFQPGLSWWDWSDILPWGSKRIITACLKRGHLTGENRTLFDCTPLLEKERPLDIVRWIFQMPVEDLPSIDNFFTVRYQRFIAYELAWSGQKEAITMLKQQELIDPWLGNLMYQGAGEAGSMDMIRWLDMSLDKFVGSMDLSI